MMVGGISLRIFFVSKYLPNNLLRPNICKDFVSFVFVAKVFVKAEANLSMK